MPVPSSYTEPELAEYMVRQLGTVADVLGWTAPHLLIDAVSDALILCGVSTVGEVEAPRLRAVARLTAWRAAVGALSGLHDFSADGQSMSLSQAQSMALRSLAQAERDAAEFGIGASRAYAGAMIRSADPYVYRELDVSVE